MSGPYTDAHGTTGTCTPGANATTYAETYTYHPAGGVTGKTLTVNRRNRDSGGSYVTNTASTAVTYGYYPAGQLGSSTYQIWMVADPLTFANSYDSMGRPYSLTDNAGTYLGTGLNTTWAASVAYDAGGRMTNLVHYLSTTAPDCSTWANNSMTESMTYNVNGQMKSKAFSAGDDSCYYTAGTYEYNTIQYNYSGTQNNGQITGATESATSETLSYAYDALQRLTGATSTPTGGGTANWNGEMTS